MTHLLRVMLTSIVLGCLMGSSFPASLGPTTVVGDAVMKHASSS